MAFPMNGATGLIRMSHQRTNQRFANGLHRLLGFDPAPFHEIGERSRTERAVEEFRKGLSQA